MGENWWLADVMLDSTHIALGMTTTDCNFKYVDSDFEIIRKNCDTILVKMSDNKSTSQRTLYIQLEAGDYFDGIKITQDKK